MLSKNEMIMINRILNTELSIRQMAKQLGLRRDDFISRIREMIKDKPELLEQLDLVLVINQMLYANMSVKEASKKLNITEKELDKRIRSTLANNSKKLQRYEDYLDPKKNKRIIQRNIKKFRLSNNIEIKAEAEESSKKSAKKKKASKTATNNKSTKTTKEKEETKK